MKKGIIIVLLVIASIFFVAPVNTYALESNSVNVGVQNNSYILSNTINIAECDPSNSILGDPSDDGTVAWLVQMALNIIKVAGPILVVLLSSIDFIVVIVKSDNDQFGKAQKKLITRLILALLLFLVPVIVQVILQLFGIMGDPSCGLQ